MSGTAVLIVCSSAKRSRPRPTLEEVVAERLERARLGVDEGASRRDHGIEVDADQALAELALLDPIEHRLDERAEAPRVACADHVDRPAHEREPDDATLDDQLGQGLRSERRRVATTIPV